MSDVSRARRVDRARVSAGLSVQKLWLHYISLSGIADLLEVDAYLHGLIPLGSYQEDKLSYAVNEQLDARHRAARLTYAHPLESPCPAEDPLDVLRELLGAVTRDAGGSDSDPHPEPPPR